MFSWNLNFLFIFYIKLDCGAWDRVFWQPWTLLFQEKCYLRFFSWSVTSPMTSYKFRGKLWNLANDVIIAYFWLSEVFLLRLFVYLVYFRPFSTEIAQKIHTELTTSPTSRFPVHISLNPMFHCNTRHSYDLDGLKFKFIVWRIDEVFLVMRFWLCWPSAQK